MPTFHNAWITGASSGLGREIAQELARRGTRVFLSARRAQALARLVDEIGAAGGRAEALPLDVSDPEAVRATAAAAEEASGGLDLVLADAGVGAAHHATRLSWDDVESVIRINVLGAFATLHAALGPLLERGRGTLAATSSVAALRGLPQSGAYSASKAAVSTFLETLSLDLDGTGVRVVDLCPGFVRTPMTDDDDFPQPFKVDFEDAALRCVKALERGTPTLTFPLPMALVMGSVRHLPGWAWRSVGRIVRRRMPVR